jgi:protocatechuate 3,4-dioxygenase beta subunit
VLALDGAGSVYLSGWTCSSDFPTTTGAFDRTFGGCSYSSGGDTFVTKLNSAGTGLVYSTYLGGSNYDSSGQAIAVNASGEAYVVGFTRSSDFPTTAGAYDTTPNGAEDATLVKLNASGSGQLYGTLLGGSGFDAIWGLAVSGNTAYLSGATASADFPTTADAYDRTYAGGTCGSYACRDVFAAKLDMAANQLVYSTYLGGGNDDYQASQSLAVDGSGAIYLAGWTKSGDFPTTAGAFDANHNGGADVFVVKLGESGAGWTRIYPATTPPIRSYYAMAYDSDRGRTLIFGGVGTSESQCYGETWEYDGVTWTRVATTGPSPRSSAKMVYDTARRQVILFGGYIGCTSHNPSNDTWAYNPTTRVWSQLAPATSPSLRDGGQFAFDSFRQVAVLFGGWNDYYYLNDTWEFNGTNWQQRSPAHAPVGLAGGAFAYDSVRHKVVLVGGFCDGYCDSSSRPEMWEYDGADWTLIASTTPVGPNNSGAMAYDSQRQRLLLFGGNIPSGLTNRTWEYDGTTWTLLSLAVSPTPRYGHQMVYDAARARMVVYGGYDGSGNLNDTWEYAAGGSPTCYPISGRVTDGSGNPVAGVTISDGAGHTATTDASGNYTVSCLSAGTYTLTPSKTNYTFSPASRTISVPPSAPDQNFTATAVLSSIAGRVTDGSGNPIAGVTISDGAGHTATSDASGNYTLSGLAAGTYTLTPSKSGYTFSPASRTVSVPPSATGQNFTATVVVTYSISGRVTDGSSNPVSGVTLSDGVGHTVTTDTSGNYLFSGLAAGTYTVTPSKSGCAFSPPSRMVSLPPNATDQNFTCGTTPTRVKILPANKRAYLTGTFTVTLTVENVTNLGAFQTELIYAPATVHVTAVTLGAFLGSTGRTVTPVGPTIDNTAGKVTFGAFSFGSAAGPNGSGTLAVITFQPRAVGTMTLHLQNLGLADPNGNAIAAATEDGQVQVTNCFGDFDGDNDVDIFDLQRAASHWNCRTGDACYDAQYDTEPDGDIDVFDLQRFAAAWGTVCTTATAQRKAWPAFESATLPEALASASLSLLPAARQAAPGEVITQTVRLADAVNVGAFQTTLTYNPAVVQVEGVTLGAFLGSTGRTVVPVGPTIDNAVGQVTFGAFTFGSQVGVSGAGDLAYVRFRAGTGGQTALAFQGAGLSDPQGNALELDSQTGAEVTVGTQASLLLLPTAQTATAGREFFVTLRVSDAANLAAFQAAVAYNPAVAQATGVALGPF